MNRMRFTGLIVMMLLSVIGIIWVQTVWIRDAVRIQNESFNTAASVSLYNARNSIESSRKMNFFNNFMMTDPASVGNSGRDISGFLSINGNSLGASGKISVNITNQSYSGIGDSARVTTVNRSIVFNGNKPVVSDSVSYFVAAPDGSGRMQRVSQTGVDGPKAGSGYVRQNEYLDMVKKRASEFQNMSDETISEIYSWEKALDVDKKEIEVALKKALYLSNIETAWEFALIKDGVIQTEGLSKSQKSSFMKSKYMVPLFPDNIIRQDLILSVVFPERANYVLGSMALILGGSLLFSLFILATFALSLYFILRQKKISEMKSDFINNMTHEFKTPIATISLAADTITNPKVINDEKSVRHFIGMIKKENSRMNKKVETILQIASLDKKEIEFRYENISVHSVIKHTVETIEIQIHQRNGKINFLPEAENDFVYGDGEHISNLVNNLLDNAIKYSPDNPDITIRTKNSDKGVVFSVEDKGIGMTKAVQSKIFERFYRQSSGNVHDVKGFGLGLNYARAIIDAHRGTINVFSEPGKGSRFEVFLPFNWDN